MERNEERNQNENDEEEGKRGQRNRSVISTSSEISVKGHCIKESNTDKFFPDFFSPLL